MDTQTIIIIVASALGALLIVYGALRKFSRMSWTGWQFPAVFGFTLLLQFLPVGGKPEETLIYTSCILLGAIVLVLGLGALARWGIRRRTAKAATVWRVFDRIGGSLLAILNFATFLLIVGGFALNVIGAFEIAIPGMEVVYDSPVWTNFFSKYAGDFMLIAFFFFAIKGGYRLGVIRSIWVLVSCLLVMGALAGAIALVIKVPFLAGWCRSLAGKFSGMDIVLSTVLGYGIIILIVFIIFFAIIMVLNWLFNRFVVRKLDRVAWMRITGGIIVGLVFCAISYALVCGLFYGVDMLKTLELPSDLSSAGINMEEISAQLEKIALQLEKLFTSSPLSAIFYAYNPIRLIIGG